MFRASFRLPRRALLTSSVATAGVGLVHDTPQERERLSIYAEPTPEILLQETPSPLELQIGVARRRFLQTYSETHSHVQGAVSKWIGVEHAVENRVKAIISPEESLTPGLLYVGVATLSGSIIARNRFLPTRLLLPPAFLLISANHFLPKTTTNLRSYFASLEETYFPSFAEKHETANQHTLMTWERIKDTTQNGRGWLNKGAEKTMEKIQETTGLKLKETLGWTHVVAHKVEGKVAEAVKVAEEKVRQTTDSAQKLHEDIKETK
ncbi:apolipo protein O-domain-containing protein [Collybia nuda]|uniref:MICOS complex subunit n=1 Tax=Collybia nuda TaxID=64659 RepID=A0A9P5YE68_9AGAR|nr:apolipo protein O-domain-containing protein [Collybia nuda]